MTVNDKLKEFYLSNNLKIDGGVNEKWNRFKIGSFGFSLPNLNNKGYIMHDINHILSDFGIDWLSEFEIASWELGSGGRKRFGLSNLYPITGTILGLFIIPKRTIKAYKIGLKRINAHILSSSNKEILDMGFEQLKKLSFLK